jgi:hypothetical protein
MAVAELPLADTLGRGVRDLRISVTDRCQFRCTYCMPREVFGRDFAFLPRAELLTFEELTRLARIFAGLGVRKLRLTGGEPLLRRDLDKLVVPQVRASRPATRPMTLERRRCSTSPASLWPINGTCLATAPSASRRNAGSPEARIGRSWRWILRRGGRPRSCVITTGWCRGAGCSPGRHGALSRSWRRRLLRGQGSPGWCWRASRPGTGGSRWR